MPRYKLVVFDFDGTLADSAPWFRGVLNQLAERHGFRKVSEAEIDMLRGRTNREIVRHLGVRFWRLPFIARDARARSAAAADGIPLFADVPDLLRDLAAAGVAVAIVSSNSEATIRRILGPSAARVHQYDCGVSLFGKARTLDRVRRRSGLAHADVLCIGDEVRDIDAARQAGLASGAVLWGYANEAALAAARPTFLFPSVESIRAVAVPGSRPCSTHAGQSSSIVPESPGGR